MPRPNKSSVLLTWSRLMPSARFPLSVATLPKKVVELRPKGSNICSLTYCVYGVCSSTVGKYDNNVYILLLYCHLSRNSVDGWRNLNLASCRSVSEKDADKQNSGVPMNVCHPSRHTLDHLGEDPYDGSSNRQSYSLLTRQDPSVPTRERSPQFCCPRKPLERAWYWK